MSESNKEYFPCTDCITYITCRNRFLREIIKEHKIYKNIQFSTLTYHISWRVLAKRCNPFNEYLNKQYFLLEIASQSTTGTKIIKYFNLNEDILYLENLNK